MTRWVAQRTILTQRACKHPVCAQPAPTADNASVESSPALKRRLQRRQHASGSAAAAADGRGVRVLSRAQHAGHARCAGHPRCGARPARAVCGATQPQRHARAPRCSATMCAQTPAVSLPQTNRHRLFQQTPRTPSTWSRWTNKVGRRRACTCDLPRVCMCTLLGCMACALGWRIRCWRSASLLRPPLLSTVPPCRTQPPTQPQPPQPCRRRRRLAAWS